MSGGVERTASTSRFHASQFALLSFVYRVIPFLDDEVSLMVDMIVDSMMVAQVDGSLMRWYH